MDIEAIVDQGLGNSSYVLDLGDGQGLVIDPERDPGPYLRSAERRRLRLGWVVETHLHADFVSGGRQLAAEGARLLAPAESQLGFSHQGLRDGDRIDLGGLTLQVIATPGHTPEHLAYLVLDDRTPLALFSGGTLIAGGIARTDLVSPDLDEELARAAFRSIHQRLLTLPDDLPVYPTHGSGSFCSVSPTGDRVTTIGRERESNPLLQIDDEERFVTTLLSGLGSFPAYFLRLRQVNRAGPKVYEDFPPPLPGLAPDRVADLVASGAEVVDLRPIELFAQGHLPGSISIELRAAFGTWLGWVVDPGRTLVFVADSRQDLEEAVRQALNVGYEDLAGRLAGGVDAWAASGRSLETIPLVASDEVAGVAPVVDIRQEREWESGHVPGAIHVELGTVPDRVGEVPSGAVVHCGAGQRAMTAASLMRRGGASDVSVTRANAAELIRAAGRAR